MENTLANKANFLQQIAGIGVVMTCIAKTFQIEDRILNGVLLNDKLEHTLYLSKNGYSDFYAIEEWIPNLRPLSSITDEDSRHLADKLLEGRFELAKQLIYILEIGSWFDHAVEIVLYALDYLRSKGYALPFMGLSVEKLIEYGWLKLKQD